MKRSVSRHTVTAQLATNGVYTRHHLRGIARLHSVRLPKMEYRLPFIFSNHSRTSSPNNRQSSTKARLCLSERHSASFHLDKRPAGNRRLGLSGSAAINRSSSNTSIDGAVNGTIFDGQRTISGTTFDRSFNSSSSVFSGSRSLLRSATFNNGTISSSGSISRSATFNSSAATNRHREAINVLADSIAPASSNSSSLAKVCASLGVAVEEPQHPVDSSRGEKASVRLAVSTTMANAVQVTLPSRKVGRKSSVIALALEVRSRQLVVLQHASHLSHQNSHSHKQYHPALPAHKASASSTAPPTHTRPTSPN